MPARRGTPGIRVARGLRQPAGDLLVRELTAQPERAVYHDPEHVEQRRLDRFTVAFEDPQRAGDRLERGKPAFMILAAQAVARARQFGERHAWHLGEAGDPAAHLVRLSPRAVRNDQHDGALALRVSRDRDGIVGGIEQERLLVGCDRRQRRRLFAYADHRHHTVRHAASRELAGVGRLADFPVVQQQREPRPGLDARHHIADAQGRVHPTGRATIEIAAARHAHP
ncbi:MAG: hypothetical protein ABJE66_11025 [Deltaproteobacteria bacterium]